MATHRKGEAYDFELFEPKRQLEQEQQQKNNIIRLPQEQLEKNRRPKHRGLKVISMSLFLLAMMTIAGSLVYGQVRLTELTEDINTYSTVLEEQQSVYVQLKMKSDAKLSLQTVEDYAENNLGMRKIEQSQVEYISLSKGDKSQVVEEEQSQNLLTSIWDFIQQLLS
ncbi:hypothetical protein [Anaeromassilibacillus senegalensis]|uniref:hypothetical protein n=1 Tax=Anaeromassilibacillus senegalensis TaxID=1673717 RepID=UPI0006837085|nr:hypothetical protein [Anaeromassilibacillus senegalensis]